MRTSRRLDSNWLARFLRTMPLCAGPIIAVTQRRNGTAHKQDTNSATMSRSSDAGVCKICIRFENTLILQTPLSPKGCQKGCKRLLCAGLFPSPGLPLVVNLTITASHLISNLILSRCAAPCHATPCHATHMS